MYHDIDPDIRRARTLPGSFYTDAQAYATALERCFVPSWQWIGDVGQGGAYRLLPFTLLEGSLDEPLLLSRSSLGGEWRCLSNVCTHRGNILVEQPSDSPLIRCGYHGRCFGLDGRLRSMPEFEDVEGFPADSDHLPRLPLERLGVFLFASLRPALPFERVFEPLLRRMDWFPFDQLTERPDSHSDYTVQAHWALYCDNYLEGFHVPFVHPELGARLDYDEYDTEVFEYCNLQVGVAEQGAAHFDLPAHSPDYGKRIHAYYWWIFPNLMLNIYTWGISVNAVEPLGLNRTRIRFRTYLLPGKNRADFSGQVIHQTEMQDEAVVESVQRGIRSRLYGSGRFSPRREQGVHHFHGLLSSAIGKH